MSTPYWPFHFTAEGISVLRVCPYQYQKRYIEGIPERIFSGLGRPPGELNRAQVGELVHRCLELSHLISGMNFPQLVKTTADSLGLSPPAPEQQEEIVEMLERFHRSDWGQWIVKAGFRRHEVPFVCQVHIGDQWSVASDQPLVTDVCIKGQVDCILGTQAGETVLLDYKTHDLEARDIAAVLPQHEFQIQVYAYALRQAIASSGWADFRVEGASGRPAGRDANANGSNESLRRKACGVASPTYHLPPTAYCVIWYLRPGLAHEVTVWPMGKAEEEIVSCLRSVLQAQGGDLPKRAQLDQVCHLCGYYPWACRGPQPR